MLAVADAQAIVLQHARRLTPVAVPLGDALGRILADDVISDVDMPPFDKAMMDGYAVRSADLAGGPMELDVVDEITAGRSKPIAALRPGQAARIMTGAPTPGGADAVVMIEQCEMLGDGRGVRIAVPVRAGQHIQPRARELRRGGTVQSEGSVIRPQEIGLLAIAGCASVRVIPAAEVAIISTGDEIVEPTDVPGPGQIRNSNGPMLRAQAARAGAMPRPLGIARDRIDDLRERIGAGLRSPVLILSGGVSAGKLDLVPGVLADHGVVAHFHKVAMKPGKPVLFGSKADSLVFGLPGNPVSAFVAFELFVRPALDILHGLPAAVPPWARLPLANDFPYSTDRPTYHPARAEDGRVRPVAWQGSPDLRALTLANALMLLPAGDHVHPAGAALPVLMLD